MHTGKNGTSCHGRGYTPQTTRGRGRAGEAITVDRDERHRTSRSLDSADVSSVLDVEADLSNEAVGDVSRVAARAEGGVPLAIGELREQLSGPPHVVGPDALLKQLRMRASSAELDEAVSHACDEPALLVPAGIVAARTRAAAVAERGPQIADDIPMFDFAVGRHPIERVVRVFQIGAVEEQQDGEQTLMRRRSDEWVPPPGPRAHVLERRRVQSKPAAGTRAAARCGRLAVVDGERGKEIYRRLVIAHGAQYARDDDFRRGLRDGVPHARLHVPLASVRIRGEDTGFVATRRGA